MTQTDARGARSMSLRRCTREGGRHKGPTGIAAGLLVLGSTLLGRPALAEPDPHSAALHYKACKSLLTRDDRELHLQGSCAGHIAMLLQLSDVLPPVMRFCVPERSTVREATEAVTSYMDRHASDLHLAFSVVAVLALREAWPCRTSGETAAHEDTRGRLLHAQPLAGGEPLTTSSDAKLRIEMAAPIHPSVSTPDPRLALTNQRRTL